MPRLAIGKLTVMDEVKRGILWSARTSRSREVGGRCKDCRWSNTFSMRLAFFRALGGTFESDPWRIFGKTFGGSGGQRWPVGRRCIFTFETFVRTFAFMIRATA